VSVRTTWVELGISPWQRPWSLDPEESVDRTSVGSADISGFSRQRRSTLERERLGSGSAGGSAAEKLRLLERPTTVNRELHADHIRRFVQPRTAMGISSSPSATIA